MSISAEIDALLDQFPKPPKTEIIRNEPQESIVVGVFYSPSEDKEAHLYDPVKMEKYCRLCKGVLGSEIRSEMLNTIFETSQIEEVAKLQSHAHEFLIHKMNLKKKKKAKDSNIGDIEISKFKLTFGLSVEDPPPINKELHESFTITAKKSKIKFDIVCPKAEPDKFELKVEPLSGYAQTKNLIEVKITLKIIAPQTFKKMIIIDVEGLQYFLPIFLQTEKSIFGSPLEDLTFVQDGDYYVPEVLVNMKNFLYENDGLLLEGIFRVSGTENEVIKIKSQINNGTFKSTKDVHCISNIIKIFFRSLPHRVLNDIPEDRILLLGDQEECWNEIQTLTPKNKDLFMWLLDILCDVITYTETNRMTSRSIAIVIAPNLYESKEDGQNSDPLRALNISQRVVNLLQLAIQKRGELRGLNIR
ncbi:rho gtpase-activating protein gaca [Anaeramoeba ignava]|uniref:Rho gtpase-activating protein gaca n=1 Tax=Anaeramoeba ignava TaxID=1746090 RepID=A0A9Q0L4S4_ANAIG|nr:rho gtpase-activating protein gaca [Anaeramoeba ignava]|eukprot:Anaeramoba_ignava/a349456_18.p1 GENE.a349456_18~~a349456_18.p1  ORF type:complete len:416 (+),score=130.70 a349456_18:268-1515(+)